MFERYASRSDLERYLAEFFEVFNVLDDHEVWQSESGALWVARRGVEPPAGARVESIGVLVMRYPPPRGDLSTPFIRNFCADATRRRCDLEGDARDAYLRGAAVDWQDEWADGSRIVFADNAPLGRGRVRGGRLESELSKGYRAK